jgi:hypothetical protein
MFLLRWSVLITFNPEYITVSKIFTDQLKPIQ